MATGSAEITQSEWVQPGVEVFVARVQDGDVNVDFQMPRAEKITIQVAGTTSNEVVSVQRSNDGSNFVALGTAIAISAPGVASLARGDIGFRHYRLACQTGDATTDITITVVGTSGK